MMFLPGPSIPAEVAAFSPHSLLRTRDPEVPPQAPAGAQTGLGMAGKHICFSLYTGSFTAFDRLKVPCQKMGVFMPHA